MEEYQVSYGYDNDPSGDEVYYTTVVIPTDLTSNKHEDILEYAYNNFEDCEKGNLCEVRIEKLPLEIMSA